MAYDEDLAYRIRAALASLINDADPRPHLHEKAMFGGLGFMLDGHMALAASGRADGIMVRVPRENTEGLLADPQASPMEMSGREIKGWVRVVDAADLDDADFQRWVSIGVDCVRGLPPK